MEGLRGQYAPKPILFAFRFNWSGVVYVALLVGGVKLLVFLSCTSNVASSCDGLTLRMTVSTRLAEKWFTAFSTCGVVG